MGLEFPQKVQIWPKKVEVARELDIFWPKLRRFLIAVRISPKSLNLAEKVEVARRRDIF